jgi:hypothetical protein
VRLRRKNIDPKQEMLFDLIDKKGKDEMNLAEYPFTLLSKKQLQNKNTIEYADTRNIDNKDIEIKWIVTGSDKYGLPTGYDQDVYLAILQSWMEDKFKSKVIPIKSVYALLSKMGIKNPGAREYDRVKKAIQRLVGVTIYSENSFYNKEEQKYEKSIGFHLFENFKLIKKKKTRGVKAKKDNDDDEIRGFITASDVLFNSAQTANLKDIDLKFFYSLSSPLSKRMYRLLDRKKYVGDGFFRMDISRFAMKIGLATSNEKGKYYPSAIKRDLETPFNELIEKGFIHSVKYKTSANRKSENIEIRYKKPAEVKDENSIEENGLILAILDVTKDDNSKAFYRKVIRKCGDQARNIIFNALSSTVGAMKTGVAKSVPKYFIGTLKNICEQHNINID